LKEKGKGERSLTEGGREWREELAIAGYVHKRTCIKKIQGESSSLTIGRGGAVWRKVLGPKRVWGCGGERRGGKDGDMAAHGPVEGPWEKGTVPEQFGGCTQ